VHHLCHAVSTSLAQRAKVGRTCACGTAKVATSHPAAQPSGASGGRSLDGRGGEMDLQPAAPTPPRSADTPMHSTRAHHAAKPMHCRFLHASSGFFDFFNFGLRFFAFSFFGRCGHFKWKQSYVGLFEAKVTEVF